MLVLVYFLQKWIEIFPMIFLREFANLRGRHHLSPPHTFASAYRQKITLEFSCNKSKYRFFVVTTNILRGTLGSPEQRFYEGIACWRLIKTRANVHIFAENSFENMIFHFSENHSNCFLQLLAFCSKQTISTGSTRSIERINISFLHFYWYRWFLEICVRLEKGLLNQWLAQTAQPAPRGTPKSLKNVMWPRHPLISWKN